MNVNSSDVGISVCVSTEVYMYINCSKMSVSSQKRCRILEPKSSHHP